MATADALDLLKAIVGRHASGSATDEIEVVLMVIHDLKAHRGLIEAGIRDAGGVLVDAAECASGVMGELEPELGRVVEATLRIRTPGGGQSAVSLDRVVDRVRGLFDGRPSDEGMSAGLSLILGIGASVFSARLRESALAVVTYDESFLDEDWADAVFELFARQLSGVGIANIRRLVVLIQSRKVNHERHCAPPVSIVCRLGDAGLERRKEWVADRAEIHRLVRPGLGPLVLFLGAGFSFSSGLPLGDELRDEALGRMLQSADPFPRLADDFHRWIESNDRFLSDSERGGSREEFAAALTLERVLREELFVWRNQVQDSPTIAALKDKNDAAVRAPGRAVEAIWELIHGGHQLVVVTVNFDTLVEHRGATKVFSGEDFDEFSSYLDGYITRGGEVPVLKLHGTIGTPETIIGTVDQYAMGLALPKARALRKLLAAVDGRPTRWVYVGYSMRDPDVTNILGGREFGEGLDEMWVSPFPISTARRFSEERRHFGNGPDFWQRSITVTADAFFSELSRAWSS